MKKYILIGLTLGLTSTSYGAFSDPAYGAVSNSAYGTFSDPAYGACLVHGPDGRILLVGPEEDDGEGLDGSTTQLPTPKPNPVRGDEEDEDNGSDLSSIARETSSPSVGGENKLQKFLKKLLRTMLLHEVQFSTNPDYIVCIKDVFDRREQEQALSQGVQLTSEDAEHSPKRSSAPKLTGLQRSLMRRGVTLDQIMAMRACVTKTQHIDDRRLDDVD